MKVLPFAKHHPYQNRLWLEEVPTLRPKGNVLDRSEGNSGQTAVSKVPHCSPFSDLYFSATTPAEQRLKIHYPKTLEESVQLSVYSLLQKTLA